MIYLRFFIFSSQCSPTSLTVSRQDAQPVNRQHRGLYVDQGNVYNADAVGAFNILRLFLNGCTCLAPRGLSNPIKVSV